MIELAFLRNKLVERDFNNDDEIFLKEIKESISHSSSKFKNLALNAIKNCEADIEKNDLKKASYEIDFIHNMPFSPEEKWNEDYFYKVELLSYIENINDAKRIKSVIKHLAELL